MAYPYIVFKRVGENVTIAIPKTDEATITIPAEQLRCIATGEQYVSHVPAGIPWHLPMDLGGHPI